MMKNENTGEQHIEIRVIQWLGILPWSWKGVGVQERSKTFNKPKTAKHWYFELLKSHIYTNDKTHIMFFALDHIFHWYYSNSGTKKCNIRILLYHVYYAIYGIPFSFVCHEIIFSDKTDSKKQCGNAKKCYNWHMYKWKAPWIQIRSHAYHETDWS